MLPFPVSSTSRYERLVKKLRKGHPDLQPLQRRMEEILSSDPHNRNRQYDIKKLHDVKQGEGQYRLGLGRWRFRYDIIERKVILHYCGLRREETYRK